MTQILPSTFNRRITVKRAIPQTDDAGGTYTAELQERFSTWAFIENLSSGRKAYLGIDGFTSAYNITLRYAPDRLLAVNDLIDYNNGGIIQTLQIDQPQLITQGFKKFWQVIGREYTPDA